MESGTPVAPGLDARDRPCWRDRPRFSIMHPDSDATVRRYHWASWISYSLLTVMMREEEGHGGRWVARALFFEKKALSCRLDALL